MYTPAHSANLPGYAVVAATLVGAADPGAGELRSAVRVAMCHGDREARAWPIRKQEH
jgi:hypothetical protein